MPSTCAQADAVRQRALGGPLDHRAVGHRVGERHAEFDDVGAASTSACITVDGRAAASGSPAVTKGISACARRSRAQLARSVAAMRLTTAVRELDARRLRRPCAMSLSPRPERLTSRMLVAAASSAPASSRRRRAWLDSSAGMMPSVRHRRWNAGERLVVGDARRTRRGRCPSGTHAPGRRRDSRGRPRSNASR